MPSSFYAPQASRRHAGAQGGEAMRLVFIGEAQERNALALFALTR